MNTAEQILVIFLSTALALFLFLAIVIAVKTIKLMNVLQDIAERADRLAQSAEAIGDAVRQTTNNAGIIKFIGAIIEMAKRKREDK